MMRRSKFIIGDALLCPANKHAVQTEPAYLSCKQCNSRIGRHRSAARYFRIADQPDTMGVGPDFSDGSDLGAPTLSAHPCPNGG